MVIDFVEGTAMKLFSLWKILLIIETFPSIKKGIEYMFRSDTIKILQSSKISVPPLLEEIDINGKKSLNLQTNGF